MSKSRLEKFLYALYSLDSSDLPKPLSRIEELYSCLVTGDEAPTFKPFSRVEKYLMAILGAYDVDSLPNPLSRAEVLLYKLAIGDDNLDDVKSFLSEHEELLAEIIRNGGVGENVNIEYVLYSLSTEFNELYNTAEKPIKSAVLKGKTLINVVNNDNWVPETDNANVNTLYTQNMSIKKGQTYTVIGKMESSDIINTSENAPAFRLCTGMDNNGTSLFFIQQSDAVIKQTFTNNENDTIHVRFFNQKTNYKKLMIIEGDYTNVDIPYFEGMQSVENPVVTITGKNLFDVSRLPQTVIVTCEGVELCGIGNAKDELDLLTGGLTQRIGGVLLDGSEYWVQSGMNNPTVFYTSLNNMAHKRDYTNSISCDKFVTYADEGALCYSDSPNGVSGYMDHTDSYPNENWFYIKCADSEGSVEKLKQWLSQNPITVKYHSTTESVKTVDISIVNQDGNSTRLSTFDDVTHVTLSSEGPIPMAELEVATKNEEDLGDSIVYTAYTLGKEHNTLYNTVKKTVKSAILNGQTLLNEGMQSVKMPVLTTSNEDGTETNILSCHEDVELRGIGNVKDELNLLTGELTQRIAKLVIDGSEYWTMEDGYRCYLPLPNLIRANNYIGRIICDGDYIISSHNINMINYNKPTLTGYSDSSNLYPYNNWLYIYIPDITTVQALKEHLSQNPVTVQYELATESIKTIDISTVDKNGNNTKLSTFNDITHVTLSSEGLIPEAKLEVAEKVTEVAASMLTISREQEVLNTTTNEQSENVDATMFATTEIYEGLL